MQHVTTDELRKVIAFNDLPEEHLQWVIEHSTYHEYEDGELVGKTGDPADSMIILIEGKADFYMDINGKLVFYQHFSNDSESGGVTGLLPYSRMKKYPGNSFAVGKIRALRLLKEHFHELENLNPEFIQRLIGYMTERAKHFATTHMQQEKVSALGRLAAGIAHELNNPAAAINRISYELSNRLFLNIELTEKLLRNNVPADYILLLRNKIDAKETTNKSKLSAMKRMELEDNFTDWFEDNGIAADTQVVETFVEAGFSADDLENLHSSMKPEDFAQVLLWVENLLSSRRIIKDLGEASSRISSLVGAIKSHVHMDRTNELQPTDIHHDIDNTLTLLGYKLREKNITVDKSYCAENAMIPAYVGELNQVWTNIIDNAIYAMDTEGKLSIETQCSSKDLNIKIIDNGKGIPPEITSRIFDPFFTTKKVGEGTGIGLDLVARIIKRHNGEIKVNSKPGRTEFQVCLPLKQPDKII